VPPARPDRPDRADRSEAKIDVTPAPAPLPAKPSTTPPATAPAAYDAPTSPSGHSAQIASTQLARPGEVAANVVERKQSTRMPALTTPMPPSGPRPMIDSGPMRRPSPSPIDESGDTSAQDQLIDDGKLDEALASYRALAKKNPQDRAARAGIELVEGLQAIASRDRLEAAQRFESALEIDPSNERAARELADMRRQATNERKGLLSRLMGKKEGPQ